MRAWGKWSRTISLETCWLQASQGVWASSTAAEAATQIKRTSDHKWPQFKSKSHHDFLIVPVAFWVFSQPSTDVEQSRVCQHVHTAVGSVGSWDSEKNKCYTYPVKPTCLVLQWVAMSFISSWGVTLMVVHVFWLVLKCSLLLPCPLACRELLNLFCRSGLCLLKKSGTVCAFCPWEFCRSADIEAENERSRLYLSCQQQPFRAGFWWVLGDSVQPRTQCIHSLLGIQIIGWLAELPLLLRVAEFPILFFVWPFWRQPES